MGTHRPEIQALRALAVALVVVYHLWPAALPGGFIGVDVFFVISGFLITALLLREIERTGTRLARRFWARRARRILPAALVHVAVLRRGDARCSCRSTSWPQLLGEMLASTRVRAELAAGVGRPSTTSRSPSTRDSPVQHFWSLSVEEQFYLVWPVLLLAGRAAPARARWSWHRRADGG